MQPRLVTVSSNAAPINAEQAVVEHWRSAMSAVEAALTETLREHLPCVDVGRIECTSCAQGWLRGTTQLRATAGWDSAARALSGTSVDVLVVQREGGFESFVWFTLPGDAIVTLLGTAAPEDFPRFDGDVHFLCASCAVRAVQAPDADDASGIRVLVPQLNGVWTHAALGDAVEPGCTFFGKLQPARWCSRAVNAGRLLEEVSSKSGDEVTGRFDFDADRDTGRLLLYWPFGERHELGRSAAARETFAAGVEAQLTSSRSALAGLAGPLHGVFERAIQSLTGELQRANALSWLDCAHVDGLLISLPLQGEHLAPSALVQLIGSIRFGPTIELAITWPVDGASVQLCTIEPLKLPLSRAAQAAAPTFLDRVIEAVSHIDIREISLTLTMGSGAPSVDSLYVTLGIAEHSPVADDEWWSTHLTELELDDFELRLDLVPHLAITATLDFSLCGAQFEFEGTLPEAQFFGGLLQGERLEGERLLALLPGQKLAGVPDQWAIADLEMELDLLAGAFEFATRIETGWILDWGTTRLELRSVALNLSRSQFDTTVSLSGLCVIAGIEVAVSVTHELDGYWILRGDARPEEPPPFADFLKEAASYDPRVTGATPGGDWQARELLRTARVKRIHVLFSTLPNEFELLCECASGTPPHEIRLSVSICKRGECVSVDVEFDIGLDAGALDLFLRVNHDNQSTWAAAAIRSVAPKPHSLSDWLGSMHIGNDAALSVMKDITVDFLDGFAAVGRHGDQQPAVLIGGAASATASFGHVPLLSSLLPKNLEIGLDKVRVVLSSRELSAVELEEVARLLPPECLPGSGKQNALPAGFTVSATAHANLPAPSAIPIGEAVAAPSGAAAGAPGAPPPVSARTLPGKTFGPLEISRIGAECKDTTIALQVDSAVRIGGLSISIDGLRVSADAKDLLAGHFAPAVSFSGLGISFRSDAVEIGGALFARDEPGGALVYQGAAVVKARQFALSAIGFYQDLHGQHSLCIYAVLDYPIGGPPFFSVEGLAAGFGYGLRITMPEIQAVKQFPLVSLADRTSVKTTGPNEDIALLRTVLTPSPADCFLALGVRFSTFQIASSFALLVVSFGREFEVDVLGVSHIEAPPRKGGPASPPVAAVDIVLKGAFAPQRGFVGIQGQLLPSSYVLSHACRLSGGFAFFSWFEGCDERLKGDFVLTVGGYHPEIGKRPHYPDVPRLAFNWQVDEALTLKGDAYFALTPASIVAGGHFEANLTTGVVTAWLKFGANFEFQWKPYHYSVGVYVDIGADVALGLCHLHAELGALVKLEGPELSGRAIIDFSIFQVSVSFGASTVAQPAYLNWAQFREAFLPAAVCTLTVAEGLILRGASEPLRIGRSLCTDLGTVSAQRMVLHLDSALPSARLVRARAPALGSPPSFGIRPMNLRSADVHKADLIVRVLFRPDAQSRWRRAQRIEVNRRFGQVPLALWSAQPVQGQPMSPVLETLLGAEFRPAASASVQGGRTVSGSVQTVVFPRLATPPLAASAQMELYASEQPPLLAGEYVIRVTQRLALKEEPIAPVFKGSWRFSIGGHRSALAPSDVHSVFPHDGARADFADVLPHIVLTQSTIPWERLAARAGVPWLALLLFSEDEIGAPQTVESEDTDPMSFIEVKESLLEAIVPQPDERALLAHVRAKAPSASNPQPHRHAFIVCNRTPRVNARNVVHLVALDQRMPAKVAGRVRLLTLYRWSFFCEAASDRQTRKHLEELKEIEAGEPLGSIEGPMQGETRLRYLTPLLAPGQEDRVPGVDRQFSHRAARELGRMLAAENATAAKALADWHHRRSQQLREHGSHEAHDEPRDIADMLERLRRLEGVPLAYLLPDERRLPEESIVLFRIEEGWYRALLRGALDLGPQELRRHDPPSAQADSPALQTTPAVSGFLLRSSVVPSLSAWRIEAHGDEGAAKAPLPLLRSTAIGPHLLLCLFCGVLRRVEFHHGVEVRHFEKGSLGLTDWRTLAFSGTKDVAAFAQSCLATA